jgi:hypothetical protein
VAVRKRPVEAVVNPSRVVRYHERFKAASLQVRRSVADLSPRQLCCGATLPPGTCASSAPATLPK